MLWSLKLSPFGRKRQQVYFEGLPQVSTRFLWPVHQNTASEARAVCSRLVSAVLVSGWAVFSKMENQLSPLEVGQTKAHVSHGLECTAISRLVFKSDGKSTWSKEKDDIRQEEVRGQPGLSPNVASKAALRAILKSCV